MNSKNYIVDSLDNNKRIDVFLSEKMDGFSRSYIQKLIDMQKINANGTIIKSNYKIKENDFIVVDIPEAKPLEIKAQKINLDIMYEDSDVIVINKPQGLVVHPAQGNYEGTVVNALLEHCDNLSGINGVLRPGIVHRIDKDTSGVIVVAKNNEAHLSLSEQFKEHSIKRLYTALLEGNIKNDKGTINTLIGRNPSDRKKMAVLSRGGKSAITHFEVKQRFENNTLIEARLETGRTHQIRVHMSYIGHPVVGDKSYGYKKQRFNLEGQLLHARLLGFIHPVKKQYMEFEASLPDYFENVLRLLNR